MLRRQKLPKKFALNQPGQTYAENFTKPTDIKFNEELDVFGRKFKINGCDIYTQKFYADKFGIDFPLGHDYEQQYRDLVCKRIVTFRLWKIYQLDIILFFEIFIRLEREIPPYNGFGDEEDSLGYVYRLIPKPPKKDFFKWVDNQVNLRFVARFNTTKPEDVDR